MLKDGLYLNHGADKHALVVIRENNGRTLWVRDFVSVEMALNVLEDDVLSGHSRANILSKLGGNRGFFTESFDKPEGGFSDCAFQCYVLSSTA